MEIRQDIYHAWVWTPYYVAQHDAQEKSGLILPGDHRWAVETQDDSAIAHFSTFYPDGRVRSWIWLFPNIEQALRLRMLPRFATGPEIELIEATIPDTDEGRRKMAYVDKVPLELLLELEPVLEQEEISEIWFGFNSQRYVMDRILAVSAQIMSREEFFDGLRRKVL